jgi:hypothetical protein
MAFTNGSRNASGWLTGGTERLLRELIGAPDQGIGTDVPQRPDTWGDICKVRLAMPSMGQPDTNVGELCKELGIPSDPLSPRLTHRPAARGGTQGAVLWL